MKALSALTRWTNEAPFRCFDNAGDDVEGNDAFGVAALAVNGKGNPDTAEESLGFFMPEREDVDRRLFQPFLQLAIGLAYLAAGSAHFVKDGLRHRISCLCGDCCAFRTY